MSLYNNEFCCRTIPQQTATFSSCCSLSLPPENSANTGKKIWEKKKKKKNYSEGTINNLSTKSQGGMNSWACISLNVGQPPQQPKGYRDENVRVNHSDRRLIFAESSASFSKKEEALDRRTVTSCSSASKVR